jgi:hypothetical protein
MAYRLRNTRILQVNAELHAWPRERLRKAIGSFGILLPLSLIGDNLASKGPLLPGSISGYYYTGMRDFLIGGLCLLGLGLLACRGSDQVDGVLVSAAGSCIILAAFCPTKPLLGGHRQLTVLQNVLGDLHDAFAFTAFTALGLIALRFARTQNSGEVFIHRSCAGTIFCCVLLAPMASRLSAPVDVRWPPLLISEVLAMCAAGISWITSGDTAGAAEPDPRTISQPIDTPGTVKHDLSNYREYGHSIQKSSYPLLSVQA